MCLAIPMRIVEITGFNARCEAKGIERTVSLFLMQHESLTPGDIVMVHVGYAIQRMTEDEARSAWELYDEMLAAEAGLDEAGHDEGDIDKDGRKERAAADHA
ncbi:MAG: HypC/HybG/HupF family hydrogenase formation chaperone [Hyphomicrobiaceae bacterium]|nr:HypC/HybG/HupF family hydrogenase formation chaperone [Hyphomicrobiaceae bacterium]